MISLAQQARAQGKRNAFRWAAALFMAAVALVLGVACSSNSDSDTAAATTLTTTTLTTTTLTAATSTTPTTPDYIPSTQSGTPFLELDLAGKIEAMLSAPNTTFAQNIAAEMGTDGDERWGPWLLDLMRLGGTQGINDSATWAFSQISGIASTGDFSEDFVAYGTWLRAEQIDPGEGYYDWKRRLFSELVQPAYYSLLSEVTDPLTLASIQWGGVVRGGIPELNNPAKLTVAEATFMTDEELVLGVVIDNQPVAYPLRFMARHEFANDIIGNIPVALGYCTLCRTGLMFDARVGGRVLTFQTSGLLLDSNKVMVDNQTDSLWQHLAGEAISGPFKGTVLNTFPLVTTRWADWVAAHPDTLTLDTPESVFFPNQPERPPIIYDYTPGAAYVGYYANENLWFPSLPTPEPFAEKTGVVTLSRPGVDVAFDQVSLEQSAPFVIRLGGADGEQFVVVPNIGGARIYLADQAANSAVLAQAANSAGGELAENTIASVQSDSLTLSDGTQHVRVVSGQSFWFAWAGLHPDALVWLADGSGTVSHTGL